MNRRTDLDLLRVVLCAAVILQHAVLIFAAEPRYHVKSAEVSVVATVVYEFLRIFAMPPFFAIAGWAAVQSLRRRDVGGFLRERAARLLVPLLVGIFLLGPVIKYIELRHGRDLSLAGFRIVEPISMDLWSFLPRYYTRIVLTTWSHLWFLAYLLINTVLALPLLLWLARRTPRTSVPRRIVVYLPAIPLATILAACHGYWPYLPNLIHDWPNAVYFALCFLAGAVLGMWSGFEERLRAEALRMTIVAGAAFAGVMMLGESTGGRVLVGLCGWGCVGAAWGWAGRFRPRLSPALAYLSAATFPVYVIHHVPLLLLGAWLVAVPVPVGVRILLIAGLDTAVSLAIYHWLIRPYRVTGWLLGNPARRQARA